MTANGPSRDVRFATDGSILEIEREVPLDSPRRPCTRHSSEGGPRSDPESGIPDEARDAGRVMRTATKRSEVQMGPGGQPLAHEA